MEWIAKAENPVTGETILQPDRNVWVMDTSNGPVVVRQVAEDTPIVQNYQAAEVVDAVIADARLAGMPVQLNVVGSLGNGDNIWWVVMFPSWAVGGHPNEEHKPFFTVRNDHMRALWAGLGRTRVVCQNTTDLAIDRKELLDMGHRGDPLLNLKVNSYMLQLLVREHQRTQEELDHMFRARVTDDQVAEFFQAVYPQPARDNVENLERAVARVETDAFMTDDPTIIAALQQKAARAQYNYDLEVQRNAARMTAGWMAYHQFNDEYPYAARTAFALENAVTYSTNHGENNVLRTRGDAGDRLAGILFGGDFYDINQRAHQEALALVS